jgi:hypothetical protein
LAFTWSSAFVSIDPFTSCFFFILHPHFPLFPFQKGLNTLRYYGIFLCLCKKVVLFL